MDFQTARRAMIDNQLRPEAVTDGAVLAAMGSIAREDYVPAEARAFAYMDRPIVLGQGRAMMPPAALGRLLGELLPRAGERALVVGRAAAGRLGLRTIVDADVPPLPQFQRREAFTFAV